MKKFYEAPAVEFTGFSAEDIITTSVIEPSITVVDTTLDVSNFEADVKAAYGADTEVVDFGSYEW